VEGEEGGRVGLSEKKESQGLSLLLPGVLNRRRVSPASHRRTCAYHVGSPSHKCGCAAPPHSSGTAAGGDRTRTPSGSMVGIGGWDQWLGSAPRQYRRNARNAPHFTAARVAPHSTARHFAPLSASACIAPLRISMHCSTVNIRTLLHTSQRHATVVVNDVDEAARNGDLRRLPRYQHVELVRS